MFNLFFVNHFVISAYGFYLRVFKAETDYYVTTTLQVIILSGTFKATLKESFGQIPGYFCKTMRCLKKKNKL